MYTAPEEQKIARVRNLAPTREIDLLRQNVYDLQKQLNAAHTRIKVLIERNKELRAPDPTVEEELIRRVMVARGINPNDQDEVVDFWSDYHGIDSK